jgi:copper chaperone
MTEKTTIGHSERQRRICILTSQTGLCKGLVKKGSQLLLDLQVSCGTIDGNGHVPLWTDLIFRMVFSGEVIKMANQTLMVEGMTCDHCVESVRSSVMAVKGVRKVSVSLKEKKVVVEFDEQKTDLQRIEDAIVEAGFEVAR